MANSVIDTIYQIITDGVKKDILHLYTDDDAFTGNLLTIREKKVVNFGSCSYLGLEFDSRLIDASKASIDRFGTQFSESRAYVSIGLYKELEELFRRIFDAPCVITPTTTLGHIANIPILIGASDAVITDQQVHNSVTTAVKLLSGGGTHIEVLRHSRMDILEDRIKFLRNKHHKIWYMADGIYSMFGDSAPMNELYRLLDLYPSFHLYIDDAHGMSIYGKHGRGSVLHQRHFHPRMIMATSLAKAFATGGAVMVYPDAETARKVRTCGGPLITSGPLQPAQLGAAIANAMIHLSPEIDTMQDELRERIKFTNLMLKKYRLPVITENNAAVFFIGMHLPKLGYNMVRRMLDAGYYVNLGIFPAVPMKNTGIRFTITRLHSFRQIEEMICTMAEELPKALKEEGMSIADIYRAFRMPIPEEVMIERQVHSVINQVLSLHVQHYKSITDIRKDQWNDLFQNKGTFDWEGLRMLEETFCNNTLPENNWHFDYIFIRDVLTGKPVLATFLTTAIWKDDMLAAAGISENVELKRYRDPYYLTSTVVATGSLLTEGEHIYIDRNSLYWKDAMHLFFNQLNQLQENYGANSIALRDFQQIDDELESFLVDNGFFKTAMPDNHVVTDLTWKDEQSFYQSLSRCNRDHLRKQVKRHQEKFEIGIAKNPTAADIDQWYALYRNVKDHSLALNTFLLPKQLFENIACNPNWEVLTLKLKSGPGNNSTVAVVFCHCSSENYNPMIIGLDYTYNADFKVYRQALYQVVLRAKKLGKKRVNLGFSAGIEKKKLGALSSSIYAFMQTRDSYHAAILASMQVASQTK